MTLLTTLYQVSVLVIFLCSTVLSQAPTQRDSGTVLAELLNPPGTPPPFDPAIVPNLGGNFYPNMPGTGSNLPAPLPPRNPLLNLLPLMLFRGGDMAQMMTLMTLMGGGLGGGSGGIFSNPLFLLNFLGGL